MRTFGQQRPFTIMNVTQKKPAEAGSSILADCKQASLFFWIFKFLTKLLGGIFIYGLEHVAHIKPSSFDFR